jgi:hypothetical protein
VRAEIRFTKWGGKRHWEFELEPLGDDEHGWWLGGRTGMTLRRGLEQPVVQPHDFVTLVPHRDWWVASFNGPGETHTDVYVDVTTAPVRSAHGVEAVDLDLDVIRLRDGTVEVWDEDEFAEHQVRYGYPAEVIERAQASCDDLVARLTAGQEPFVEVAAAWLRRFDDSRKSS